MTDSRRELIKIIKKENAFKKINNLLYTNITKKKNESKANLSNKIHEIDVETLNELLVKKILEYRQVRNYNRDEENSLKTEVDKLNKQVTEFQIKAYNMMDNIIQKQDKLIHCYENLESESQSSDIMLMKLLVNEHSRLFAQFCSIIDEKHKRSIKLFWLSENKRERAGYGKAYSSFIIFDDLQHQNKFLREKLADRKGKIKHEKNKLDAIITDLDSTKKEIKDIEAHITKTVIPLLEQNKEKCLQASSVLNINLRIRRKLSSEKAALLKKVGILKYKHLAPHREIISADLKL